MDSIPTTELRKFLDLKYNQYNTSAFIDRDPVSVPHLFNRKEDIEIAGFLAATLSWGTRAGILKSAMNLVDRMDRSPNDFILNASDDELSHFKSFVHRTFNGNDCIYFLLSLRNIYHTHGGLEPLFIISGSGGLKEAISRFRKVFFELKHDPHVEKHIANPQKNASAKRLLMFLRWMVRKDPAGVDFGLWKSIRPGNLLCPLDVHSAGVARKLGLLKRKTNDWKAAEELTAALRRFDPDDPVKYDFALFGLGVFENF